MFDDIVVTARLRADGTGNVTVKMGQSDNVAGLLGALIEACRNAQSQNRDNYYRHYNNDGSECSYR